MNLLADAGSTKTAWYLCESGQVVWQGNTSGLNPAIHPEEHLYGILTGELLPALAPGMKERIKRIEFFGAGCGSPSAAERLRGLLGRLFVQARHLEVLGDIWAAARAACGRQAGICAIMGTGSHACLYDGYRIYEEMPALGYWLGDQAGGSNLGAKLLQSYFYGKLPPELRQALRSFPSALPLDRPSVLDRLYRQTAPNAWTASLVPFLKQHEDHPFVGRLLHDCFADFLDTLLACFDHPPLPLFLVGGVAQTFDRHWISIAEERGKKIEKILPAPFPTLLDFYINK